MPRGPMYKREGGDRPPVSSAVHQIMKNPRARLAEATITLAEAKEIVRAKKKKIKKLKKLKGSKLGAENAKRELQTIETGVEAIEQHQALLVQEVGEAACREHQGREQNA